MPSREYYLPSRQLVSQDEAAITQRANVPRSRFTGSWSRKTAFDAGYLVPFMLDEVLPGDHLTYNVTAYVRMSTPLFPMFSNQRIDTFFFYVPCRLLWENWTKFMGEQATPASSIAFTIPLLEDAGGAFAVGSIYDHFGLPSDPAASSIPLSCLPLRAYNQVYNAWFRDQNIIGRIADVVDNGPDPRSYFTLRRRAKGHDYFTSALPWPQKFTAPTVPVGGLAPILGIGALNQNAATGPLAVFETSGNDTYAFYKQLNAVGANSDMFVEMDAATGAEPQIFADLSQATGVAINTFRQAFLVQQLLERDARGGTRYVELIRSHFGVTNPDFRLQRPEYIGGGQTPLTLTPIAQTAPTTDVPLGALGAAGTAAGQHHASYAATEHGYIIGLINVRSELAYQQGLHKLWSRATRYDFYWPSLAGLGEQAILRKEIFCTGTEASDDAVFGYQERWHEYRTHVSEITGIMRSTAPGTLDMWHLAQYFLSAPTLSQAFIEDTPDMERVLAAAEESENQQYLADILIQRTAVRPIPTFGTPVTLGRF